MLATLFNKLLSLIKDIFLLETDDRDHYYSINYSLFKYFYKMFYSKTRGIHKYHRSKMKLFVDSVTKNKLVFQNKKRKGKRKIKENGLMYYTKFI